MPNTSKFLERRTIAEVKKEMGGVYASSPLVATPRLVDTALVEGVVVRTGSINYPIIGSLFNDIVYFCLTSVF